MLIRALLSRLSPYLLINRVLNIKPRLLTRAEDCSFGLVHNGGDDGSESFS